MQPVQASASVAATGLGIRYVGDYCYALAGRTAVTTSAVTVLDFTTGAGVVKGVFQVYGMTSAASVAGGGQTLFAVTFNGETINQMKTETEQEDSPTFATFEVIIPPLTRVTVSTLSDRSTAGFETSTSLVGRVYGAE